MGFRINTNVAAIKGMHSLVRTNAGLSNNYNRLSTGLRINKAADDSAGLGVSESLRSEIRGMKQAQRNANDGISIIQTAEGTLNEIQNNLQRLRELAVQAASETLASTERAYIETEADQLADEIDRLANNAEFNGINLLGDANTSTIAVQVGAGVATATNQITITLSSSTASALAVGSATLNLSTAGGALTAITALDTALDSVSSQRATLGALQNRLTSATNALANAIENLSSAESQIRDVDFAEETAEMSKNSVLQQSGVSVLAQANSSNQAVLKLLG